VVIQQVNRTETDVVMLEKLAAHTVDI